MEDGLDLPRARKRLLIAVGNASAAFARGRGVVLADAEGRERGLELCIEAVNGTKRGRDVGERLDPAKLARIERPPDEELGDEGGRISENRRHGRRHADGRRRSIGDGLGLAVDSEEVGVLARDADHVLAIAEAGAVIAVGDPALKGDRRLANPSERRLEKLDNASQIALRPLTRVRLRV
jgi:hypothetical protein